MKRTRKPLTARQRRVIYLIAEDCLNKQIAALMGISEGGVKKHVESLRKRYGVRTRGALVHAAIVSGDIRPRLRRKMSAQVRRQKRRKLGSEGRRELCER